MSLLPRKSFLILVFLLSASVLFAQTPDWSTVSFAGGSGNDRGTSIAVDASGNSYVAGYFYEEATFGNITLTSALYKELFVAKMATDGTWLWAVNAGGSNHSEVRSLVIDDAGNAYVTGNYNGTGNFGGHTITSNAYSVDAFAAKINSNGTWQWAVSAGGSEDDYGYSIGIDNTGNTYLTGTFQDVANFGATTLTSHGSSDIFIAKLNSSGAWMGALGAGSTGYDLGFTLTVDASNHVYVSGTYSGTVSFGTTQLISVGDTDSFVTKLDSFLSYVWASSAEGLISDIEIDESGNAYICGATEEQATFGTITVSDHIYLAKMNNAGEWIWADGPGGDYWGDAWSLAIDTENNIFVTGDYDGNIIFGSSSFTSDLNSQETMYVAKLDADGEWAWAKDAETTWSVEGHSVSINGDGVVSVTGKFNNTISFGSHTITSAGSSDIFCVTLHDTASFTANFTTNTTEGAAPLTINFTDQSVGNPTAWAWDFQNDGTIDSEIQNPSFIYSDVGTYTVQLTISEGDNSNSVVMSDLIQVHPSIPVADFSANELSGDSPLTISFNDLSQGTPTAWEWDFQNDGSVDSYEQNPQFTYSDTGTYSVALTVSNVSGSDTELKESYISVRLPNTSFTVKLDGSGDYTSIQSAIDGVSDGHIVIVHPGSYVENIDFGGKNITVESLYASTDVHAYIDETIINGGHNSNTVTINDGENSSAELTGFTITNGAAPGSGGGILIYGSSPTISYCKIMNNEAVNYGGGIACIQNANPLLHHLEVSNNTSNEGGGINVYLSSPVLENILISNNSASSTGGGLAISDCSELEVKRLTMTQNEAQWGGGFFITSSQISISNSILWANAPEEIYFNYYYDPNQADIAYSDIEGGTGGIVVQNGTLNMGDGNLNVNPRFSADFRLTEISPCIDAGDPSSEFDPDSTRADMGAFHYDPDYVSIDSDVHPIQSFMLEQNFPNPFNPNTTIRYYIPETSRVTLSIYDIMGRTIRTLVNTDLPVGVYEYRWNGTDEAGNAINTGVYFCRLKAGEYTHTIKLAFIK